MTKKQTKTVNEDQQRQSRKEVLKARKEREQKRTIYIATAVVGGILLVVLLVAIINEVFVSPNRAVAEVSGESISLREWQDRVRLERTQRILLLENQLETFGDVALIQQFYGQLINELLQPEQLGQTVLNQMAEEVIVLQAAGDRGISVSDAEVDEAIGESFNYFGGQSPTPLPAPTETIMPTPSITPIPTAVITELLPTNTPFPTATLGPTVTPPPTATPVSQTAFQEQLSDLLVQYQEKGISETQYREYIRLQLYREKLAEALGAEFNLPTEAPHASFFFMAFDTEEDANEAQALVEANGFLQTWNELRSRPIDPEATSNPVVSELLWRTQDEVEQSFGADAAATIFGQPVNEPTAVIVHEVDEETNRYYIVMVSGQETRPLTEAAITQARQQQLSSFLDGRLTGNLTFTEFDRGRTPEIPRLDPIFYTQPTATPAIPATVAP
ncbi:MAG: SurA N-terminal domain-containing protein [Anaerolineae bacterium]|nr:SurA N-terminal domain-containing protein [Anaerolineae bacterium]